MLWPQIQLQDTNPKTAKSSALTKRFPAPAKALFIFQQHLIWTNSSSTREIQLPGVPRGALTMKAAPFFHWAILSKKGCKTELSCLRSRELESACLASSLRIVAVPARAPGALTIGPVLRLCRAQRHLLERDKARLSFTVPWVTLAWRSDQAEIQVTG